MTIKKHLLVRYIVALFAATPLLWIAPPIYSQSAPTQDSRPAQDSDITRQELARFDQFLDSHREIAEQLRKNPWLVNDRTFVEQHQALQTYLQQHPAVRDELKENPNAFMRQEERFDRREDARDNDITRRELVSFDRFLDSHRETTEQLRKDPSLVNNREYLEKHPELQAYLQEHPGVREEIKENPNAFMRQEERFDRREDARDRDRRFDDRDDARNGDRDEARNDDRRRFGDRNDRDRFGDRDADARNDNRRDNDNRQVVRDRDTTRGQLTSFDQFLDKHREIAEQLHRDPSLVKNRQFVDSHPALQAYLQAHQGVREEITENPNAFMQQENRYENRENGMGRDLGHERASFGEFLGSHSSISAELSKNPSLVKNQEFVATHPALKEYLKAHPGAQTQLTQNPESFIKSAQQFNTTTKTGTSTTGSVKTTTPDAAKPPKQ